MSHAVRRLDIQPTAPEAQQHDSPTTATVRDHICLFTHDLRRKQKRWQDGRLKYHTFNKKVIVYDDRGNFVGDAHWQADGDLDDGEELELDRGAAIVQVAECVGSREQDLTEVLDKRVREVEKRRAEAANRSSAAAPRVRGTPSTMGMATPNGAAAVRQPLMQSAQMRHKPLSSLVASPAPLGRAAVPARSPYEARMAERKDGDGEGNRAAKRRKVNESPPSRAGFAQSLFGTRLTLSAVPSSMPAARQRPLRDATNLPSSPQSSGVTKNRTREVTSSAVLVEDNSENDTANAHTNVQSGSPPSGQRTTTTTIRKSTSNVRLHSQNNPPPQSPQNPSDSDVIVLEDEDLHGTTTSNRPARNTKPITGDGGPSDNFNSVDDVDLLASESEAGSSLSNDHRAENPSLRNSAAKRQAKATQKRHEVAGTASTSGQTAKGLTTTKGQRDAREISRVSLDRNAVRKQPTIQAAEKVRPGAPHEAPLRDQEQRTELRIRPGRKRGLLMMTEMTRSNTAKTTNSTESEEHSAASDDGRLSGARNSSDVDNQARRMRRVKDKSQKAGKNLGLRKRSAPETSSGIEPETFHANKPETALQRRRSLSLSQASNGSGDDDNSVSERVSESDDEPFVRHRETRCEKREDGDVEATGPRISRMARKSVKSKEIFGFLPPGITNIIAPVIATAAENLGPERDGGRQAEKSTKETNGVTSHEAAAEQTNSTDVRNRRESVPDGKTTDMDCNTAPKLVNPATRGRKAARKEDAAGQVPQALVPSEPVTTVSVTKPVAPVASPGSKAVLPGFARASGGAWSRHAEDLLGMCRPEGKRSTMR